MGDEIVGAVAISGCYPSKTRVAIAWTAYVTGWVVWFVSLWMPATIFLAGTNPNVPPTSVALWFVYLMVSLGETLQQSTPDTGYLVLESFILLPYYLALLAAAGGGFCKERVTWWITRLTALGLLESVYYAWLTYQSSLPGPPSHEDPLFLGKGMPLFPGFPTLAVASTLICIGLWLIPPRQKGEDAGTRKQSAESRAGPGSISGGE